MKDEQHRIREAEGSEPTHAELFERLPKSYISATQSLHGVIKRAIHGESSQDLADLTNEELFLTGFNISPIEGGAFYALNREEPFTEHLLG